VSLVELTNTLIQLTVGLVKPRAVEHVPLFNQTVLAKPVVLSKLQILLEKVALLYHVEHSRFLMRKELALIVLFWSQTNQINTQMLREQLV